MLCSRELTFVHNTGFTFLYFSEPNSLLGISKLYNFAENFIECRNMSKPLV